MLCHKCGKNEATIRIYYEVDGIMIHRDFCEQCAVKRCSCCNYTFDDILKSGKCGCSQCYIDFYEQLLPHIKKSQNSIKHIGKTPKRHLTSDSDKSLAELQFLLKELISEENYEQAAVIRDKIKKLEAQG